MDVRVSNKYRPLLECLLLLAIATTLRCLFIGKTDLGRDEAFSLYMSQLTIPDIVKILCKGDNPPLWEILLHGWIKVFGISEVAIRILSLIFSVLTVIPIYFIGEKHIHRFAGIAASLCYCCSTFSIYMSHECRVYSLISFLTACSAWLFLSSIKESKPFKFILLTLVNLMLMYGHYLAVWVIVMEFLIVFLIRPIRQKIWKPYLIHAIALILFFIPMFPVLFTRFLDSGMNGTWIEKSTGLADLYDFMWRMCNIPLTTVVAIGIMLAMLVNWVIALIHKEYRFGTTSILTLLWLVPLMVSFFLSFFTGFLLDRYFYFLFPPFYLAMVAYCIALFPKRKAGQLALTAMFVILMVNSCSPDSSTKRFSGWHADIKPIVKQLVEAKEHDNALVILPENFDKQFVYYLDENHEIFRTHRKPVNYYVFQDYLHQQGYYYEYELPQLDQSQYSRVVFPFQDYSAPPSNLP
ncbi:MAG: glycosyltransferase family 39 protein [Bacteroidales bacterium]|nr:glycosyltransferase family 39 protein [Bacteroidales bacterium]